MADHGAPSQERSVMEGSRSARPVLDPSRKRSSVFLDDNFIALQAASGEQFATRPKASSTSTIYIEAGSMTVPDHEEILRSISCIVQEKLQHFEKNPSKPLFPTEEKIFWDTQVSPRKSPSTLARVFRRASATTPPVPLPSSDEVERFMRNIYVEGQLNSECIIVTLIYLERFLKTTQLNFCVANWRPVMLCCMMLASKVWDDLSMVNVDFSIICPSFTLVRINELERAFLNALSFNVSIPSSEYAKYYFRMRSRLHLRTGAADVPQMKPMDITIARKLEALSTVREFDIKNLARRRFVTADAIDVKSPLAIIS
eukprot:GILK01006705.1.p1 GENE.GILK01006705.1~~GILK01006705.1.p1  ORF type:complete len:328 (+),score=22.11 GILK01006705.1:43-984(+)